VNWLNISEQVCEIMTNWATEILCPLLGLIINNIMWFSPMRAVLDVRKSKQLGDFNPIPFAFTVLNCTGWIIYGLMLNDQFIFWSNVPGLVTGLWYCLNTMAILYYQTKPGEDFCKPYQYMEGMLLFSCAFWSIISVIAVAVFKSNPDGMNNVIGISCMVFTISYYGAPLSTMVQVIKTQDSSSLFAPLILANMSGSTLWTVYGFAIDNLNVYLPNVLGASLSALQLILILIFYKKSSINGASGDSSTLSAFDKKIKDDSDLIAATEAAAGVTKNAMHGGIESDSSKTESLEAGLVANQQ
jgi:solute carrier family 50 (sugar transporter)